MLRLQTFGGLRLERDGRPYTGPASQRRRLALLAALASHRSGLSRDKLMAWLWPDADAARARHSLDDALSSLRRELQDDALFVGVAMLSLNPDAITSDVEAFAAALDGGRTAELVSLYAGPFLDGFHLPDAPEFEQWVDAERARLAAEHARALDALAADAERRGEYGDAARWWRVAVTADPLSTRAAIGLMRALARTGDRAEALRVAHVHASLMQRDLESDPGPEFASELEALRAPAAPPGSGAAAPAARPAPVTTVGAAPADTHSMPETAPPPAPPAVARAPSRRRVAVILAVVAAIATLAAAWRLAVAPRSLDRHRVAVARFENATGDPRFDALGALVADAIADGLAATGLAVANPGPARALARPDAVPRDVDSLARAFGAGTIVEGALYRQGDSVRFQARVTATGSGEVIRTIEPVLAPASDPSAAIPVLGERVRAALAAALDARLASWTAAASQPPSYDAYLEFVAGRSAWPDYPRALTHFERAAALDSMFALAHIEVAVSRRMLGDCPGADSVARALHRRIPVMAPFDRLFLDGAIARCHGDLGTMYQSARELVRLAPHSPSAAQVLALALMEQNRLAEAADVFGREDLERGGTEVGATYYGSYSRLLHLIGRDDRALQVAEQGRARFPQVTPFLALRVEALAPGGSAAAIRAATDTLASAGRSGIWLPAGGDWVFEMIIAELRYHGRQAEADAAVARALTALSRSEAGDDRAASLASILYLAGRWREARDRYAALLAADSADPDVHGGLGGAAAHLGDRATALREAAWLAAHDDPADGRQAAWRARIAAILGDRDGAVAALRPLMQHGWLRAQNVVHTRLDLEGLAGYPPLEELLRPKS